MLIHVIGNRELSPEQSEFNRRWAAPYGRRQRILDRIACRAAKALRSRVIEARAVGPFGFQPDNNATRVFEYAWAALAVPVVEGHVVVDVGGSLGGLQFVLARQGARVINVDPSDEASMGWPLNEKTFSDLNKAFRTDVELRRAFLGEAGFEDASVDRIYCISTIEHIPEEEIPGLMLEMRRILKPGGFAVLTVDLFYDLSPFTSRTRNKHGTNINIAALVRSSGMHLAQGDRTQLNGYPEFEAAAVLSQAQDHVQGHIALNTAQAFVLQR